MKLLQTKEYLILIDEEAEIKEGDYYLDGTNSLFTPQHNFFAIKSFNKAIGYYPLNSEAKELDLPLLPLVGLETEEGKILKDDGIFVYLQNGKKYKKSELELWVENT